MSELPGNTLNMNSRDLYLRLLRHVRPYSKQFAAGILAMIVLALAEPAIPALLQPLLDKTFVAKDPDYLFWSPLALMALFLVRGLANFTTLSIFGWISGKVVYDLRRQMFDRILTLPTRYFDAMPTGNLVAKVTYDVTQVAEASTRVLTVAVKDALSVIGLLGYMLYLNWKLTLLVFLVLPVLGVTVYFLGKRLRRLNREVQQAIGNLTHVVEEAARGHKVVKVFGGQPYEHERFHGLANWVRRFNFKVKVAEATGMPVVEGLAAVMIAALIYLGTSGESLTVGEFVAFLTALGLLFSPIKRVVSINAPLQRGLAGAESVFALVDEEPERETGDADWSEVAGRLAFEHVSFRYPGGDRWAIDDLTFTVEPGETLALVGPSGSGKTTIAALLPRFYDPQQGVIRVDGHDSRDLNRQALRAAISYVGQESLLFNDSIAANMAYGMAERPSMERLREVAKAAHALEFIEQMPEGFDTLVGEDGVRLSGGQRQRIAIARALMKDAPILVLDEATSALDTESERHVQAALNNLTQGRTTLVIAHRLSTVEHADRILVIKQGRIVEQGRHAELIAHDGLYASLYRNQFDEG